MIWWAPENNGAISKYQYQIKTMGAGGDYGEWTDISGSGASTTGGTISNVAGSERRNVRVRAVNAAGKSLFYGVASTDVPEAPSRLRASLDGSSVSLSWDNPGDDSIDSYWYRIKKAGAGNTYSALTEIADSDASTTSAEISVTGEGRWIVELRARLAISPGWGAFNKTAAASTGRPDAPSILGLSPAGSSSGSGAHVTWTAAASSPKGLVTVVWADPGDDSIVKYQYRIKPRPTGPSGGRYSQRIDIPLEDLVRTAATSSEAATLSYTFVLPTPEKYRIMLRAVNNEGVRRAPFNVEPSWPAPAVPTGLKATLSDNSVSLSWDNPFDGFIQGYEYRIKTAGTGNSYSTWTDITSSVSSRSVSEGGDTVFTSVDLSATINNVTGTERRVVQLRALHDVGDPGSPATASTGRPAVPSILGLSPAGSSSGSGDDITWTAAASSAKGLVTVVWADPGDDSLVKYQYSIKPRPIGPSGGRYSQMIDVPLEDLVRTAATSTKAATLSYTFVLPTPEKYRIMLRAVNNEGVRRAVFNVEPSWPAPAAPTGLEASLAGGSLSLSWDNPFDGFIQGYEYRIKTAGAGNSYSTWTDITNSIPSSSRFLEEGGNIMFTSVSLSATINNVTGTERRIVQLRALHDAGDPGNPATASTG